MDDWRNRLERDYLDHHEKVNSLALSVELPKKVAADFKSTYGWLLDRRGGAAQEILDLGCGTGALTDWLSRQSNVSGIGVDSSLSQISAATEMRTSGEYVHSDGIDFLKANRERFDGIVCNDVLEHLPALDDTIEWLEACLWALKPSGFFYCRVPNAASLVACHSLFADLTHYRLYTSITLAQVLRIGGFASVAVAPITSSHLSGKVRLFLEHQLHRALYLVCGRTFETVYTRNVCAVGFRGPET